MRRARTTLGVLLAAHVLLVGYGGPRPFHVARLEAAGGNYAPGEWVESTALSSKREITLIVMASWCPHCARMIDQLAASRGARDQVDMILFFEDDAAGASGGGLIKHPQKLAGRDLPYYLARKSEFSGLWEGYPTILGCTREGCRRKSRAEIGLR